jgi:hypothetical protein
MNATDSTFPSTFEEYLARWVDHGIGVEDHLDEIREMYDRERLAFQAHPQLDDMPPCPAWCALDYGHRYESIVNDDSAPGTVTLQRFHTTASPSVGTFGSVGQEEYLRDGRVSYGPLHIVAGGDLEEIAAEEARRRAYELVKLADLLDEITR